MTEELRPCPFCGGKPQIYCRSSGWFRYRIRCHGIHTFPQMKVEEEFMSRDRDRAIKRWNRYADDWKRTIKKNEERFKKKCWKKEGEE